MRLATAEDDRRQALVAAKLAAKWLCDWGRMGSEYAKYDVYFYRNSSLRSIAEIKCNPHNHSKYPHVFLDVHKWFMLTSCEVALDIPALYIVANLDGIYMVRIGDLIVSNFRKVITGRTDRGLTSDRRPAIQIPADLFRCVSDADGIFDVPALCDAAVEEHSTGDGLADIYRERMAADEPESQQRDSDQPLY